MKLFLPSTISAAAALLQLSWKLVAANQCIRNPSIECRDYDRKGFEDQDQDWEQRHVQLLTECEAMKTCRKTCYPFANPCPLADSFCWDEDDSTGEKCSDFPTIETCQVSADCLWILDAALPLQGPFDPVCNDVNVVAFPGSITSGSLQEQDICLDVAANAGGSPTYCGLPATSTALGKWTTMRSGYEGPMQLTATLENTAADFVVSVFSADAQGQLTCLASASPGIKGEPVQLDLGTTQADQVFYVLSSVLDWNTTQRLDGRRKLEAGPKTAKFACEFQCEVNTRLHKATCSCDAQSDGTYYSKEEYYCEDCIVDSNNDTLCHTTSEENIYKADGSSLPVNYCYRYTKGFQGQSFCYHYDDMGVLDKYSVNGQDCSSSPSTSCDQSDTIDCSAFVTGAVFDWCKEDGLVGIFVIEKAIYFDFAILQRGECFAIPATESPTAAPTMATSAATSPMPWASLFLSVLAGIAY